MAKDRLALITNQIDAIKKMILCRKNRSIWQQLFFHSSGRPKKLLLRLFFHRSGKPRAVFKKLVLNKNGRPRSAFLRWMESEQYRALPRSVGLQPELSEGDIVKRRIYLTPRGDYLLRKLKVAQAREQGT